VGGEEQHLAGAEIPKPVVTGSRFDLTHPALDLSGFRTGLGGSDEETSPKPEISPMVHLVDRLVGGGHHAEATGIDASGETPLAQVPEQ
jgi:hypothetical protein